MTKKNPVCAVSATALHDEATAKAMALHKCGVVRDGLARELATALERKGQLESARPPAFDADRAGLAMAKARVIDAVHGTQTTIELETQHTQQQEDARLAAELHARELAQLSTLIDAGRVALLGAERAYAEMLVASKAATAAAARADIESARRRYRDCVVSLLDSVSDILALETLAMLDQWPDSRALTVRGFAIELPALGAFGEKDRRALSDVGATFVPAPADAVRMSGDGVRVKAMEDLRAIRSAIEGVEQ